MIDQPKRYKKFLATATTATLVASAIVPVASAASPFKDVKDDNSHTEAISALVEAGIIKGFEDGTFQPNAKLTRGQVVKMLGKWVEAKGFKVPSDYNTVQRFDDVAVDAKDQELVKYAALVKDTGVFNGLEGNLNAADSITRENMALTLDRAYKAVFGKSLIELAAGSTNLTVSDLAAAKEEALEEIQALRNLGISNVDSFNPNDTVTRGQFASFLNRTFNASAKPKPTVNVEIKSLTATAVNQLTVTFDHAVTSSDVAQFTVARGTAESTVSKVEWNEDKTQAVVTVADKFNDGTYNLTVNGVAPHSLTASVTTTSEQVASIKFLSNNLVFTGRENNTLEVGKTYKEAVIPFAVYNQYGQDITKNVSESYFTDLDVKGIDIADGDNDIKIDDGKFIVWVDEDEDDDATGTVELTYEQNDIEIDVKHDVELSDESEPAQVEIVGLYSPSDEELTVENLEDGEEYSILFKVKDQYGVEIDAEYAEGTKSKISTGDSTILKEVREGLSASVSDDDIFDIEDPDDGQSGENGLHAKDGVEVVNVDGKYYFAIDISVDDATDVKGGENTVTIRSKATGEEVSKAFTVAESDQPYHIELGLPDDIIAGNEKVKVPVFAYNKAGELITDVKTLNEDLRDEKIVIDWDNGLTKLSGKASTVFTFIEEKGNVYLKFETADNLTDEAEEYDIDIEVESSGVENTISLSVEPNAHPASIVGLKDVDHTYVFLGDEREETLVIEDQYGREFNNKSIGSSGYKYYEISVTSSNEDIFEASISGNKLKAVSKEKGSTSLEVNLVAYDVKGNRREDTFDVTFRSIEIEDFDSFKVESDALLYGGDEFDKVDEAGIGVVGLIGEFEVDILSNAYTVVSESDYLSTDGVEVTADTAVIEDDGILDDETDQYKADILVTINDTGETIRHTLTLASEDAKANSFKLNDTSGLSKKTLEDLVISYDNVTNETDHKLTASEIYEAIKGKFDLKDQYNNKFQSFSTATGEVIFFEGSSDTIRPIISAVDSDNVKGVISSNGTSNLSIELGDNGLTKGDSFNLTLKIGEKSQTVKIYIR